MDLAHSAHARSPKRIPRHRLAPERVVKHPARAVLPRGAGDDEERLQMFRRRMARLGAGRVEPFAEAPVARVGILKQKRLSQPVVKALRGGARRFVG